MRRPVCRVDDGGPTSSATVPGCDPIVARGLRGRESDEGEECRRRCRTSFLSRRSFASSWRHGSPISSIPASDVGRMSRQLEPGKPLIRSKTSRVVFKEIASIS